MKTELKTFELTHQQFAVSTSRCRM